MSFRRASVALLVAVLALSAPVDAYARAGGGFSFGSRGSRTFSAPPITATAPRPTAPLGRSAAPAQGYFTQAAPRGGFFSGGFGRGLIGGLVGAGLFGLLFGNGLFGGLGDGLSFFGLLLQLGLIYLVVRFAIGLFRRRQFAVAGGAGPGRGPLPGGPLPGAATGFAGSGFAPNATVPLQVGKADFDAFERSLVDVQTAYGAEDLDRIGRLATREVTARFASDLAENARKGLVNRVSNVRLLQGDLAEAWREGGSEFASVAMRYSLSDAMFERASSRLVSGGASPQEATEVWTFMRPAGSGPDAWRLSAIQQA